jgi:uncharacterized protein (TIGR03435 family)
MAALLFVALFFSAAQDGPQSTAARPAFEVASIKLDPSCETGGMAGRAAGITAGGLNIPCVSLRALIRVAYSGVITNGGIGSRFMEVLGGPGWLDTDRYDIAAKAEGRASQEQVAGPMLQALLEDRFHLKVHKEPRDTSVYLLTVAKNGAKLQPTKEGSCVPFDLTNLSVSPAGRGDAPRFCGSPGGRMGNGGTMVSESYGITMAEFAGRALAGYAGRPVIDQTGLTGRYDIHLEFVRDNMGAGTTYLNDVPTSVAPADTPGPSIFAALEGQLGLKLSPGKSPLDEIVVDHAEKPTAN